MVQLGIVMLSVKDNEKGQGVGKEKGKKRKFDLQGLYNRYDVFYFDDEILVVLQVFQNGGEVF